MTGQSCWDCRHVCQEIQLEKRVLVCNLDENNKILIGPVVSPPIGIPKWCKKIDKKEEIINEDEWILPNDW